MTFNGFSVKMIFRFTENSVKGRKEKEIMGDYVTNKKEMNFPSLDSLKPVVDVVNEVAYMLDDPTRTMNDSELGEVLAGALGAGAGSAISFAALYSLGTVGLSGPGIMSGLAAAGGGVSALVGGAVSASVAGIFVLAAPVAGLAALGVGAAAKKKNQQLKEEKERLFQVALRKHEALIQELEKEKRNRRTDLERINSLEACNILLQKAIKSLKKDLGYSGATA